MLKRVVQVVVMVLVVPLLAASTCGGDGPTGPSYLSPFCQEEATRCAADSDCDDGVFCNGVERCVAPNDGQSDECGCTRAMPPNPCGAAQTCSEERRRCESCTTDSDGDGHRSLDCMGDDCDDSNPNRFPGRQEVCDASDLDEDCDPATFGNRDADGDQFFDAQCCNVDGMGVRRCGSDCQDTNAAIVPGAQICNKFDSSNVFICQLSGSFGTAVPCAGVQQTCTEQPNGLGVCN